MATKLQRLGRWSFDHRRAVLSVWLLALVGVVACAMGVESFRKRKYLAWDNAKERVIRA